MSEKPRAKGAAGAGRAQGGKAAKAAPKAERGSRLIGFAAVVFRLALLVVIFALLGDWADRSLKTAPWFMVLGIVLAVLIVAVAAQRSAVRQRRRQARKRRR